MYDPYSDDPRLAIHKLYLCALSETLIVGGTAGQVIVMQFEREARQQVKHHVVMIDRVQFSCHCSGGTTEYKTYHCIC